MYHFLHPCWEGETPPRSLSGLESSKSGTENSFLQHAIFLPILSGRASILLSLVSCGCTAGSREGHMEVVLHAPVRADCPLTDPGKGGIGCASNCRTYSFLHASLCAACVVLLLFRWSSPLLLPPALLSPSPRCSLGTLFWFCSISLLHEFSFAVFFDFALASFCSKMYQPGLCGGRMPRPTNRRRESAGA